MLSKLSPEEITILAVAISLAIYRNLNNDEANALNNLLALITSNLSVQLAQESLIEENNDKNNTTEVTTPLFFS